MATLRKEVKLFIVRSLAVFNTPEETVKLVSEEYKNLNVTRQQCERYDPTKRAGKDLSKELKTEFEETRKDFLEKPLNIPSANKAVQLKILDKLVQKNKSNVVMTIKLIDQIGKITKDFGGTGGAKNTDRASVELEIKRLELEKLQREVNPPKERPPEEDYKLPLEPDEDIPNEPIL
ncbi:MAG: DUF2280 domain-containing protein [Acinetobacter sp.]